MLRYMYRCVRQIILVKSLWKVELNLEQSRLKMSQKTGYGLAEITVICDLVETHYDAFFQGEN